MGLGALARSGFTRVVRIPTLMALGVAAAIGLAAALVLRPSRGPKVVRWYFEHAGGGVVKIGQLLATRFDLLPPAYCEELGGLLDDLRPVPPAHIRAAVQQSLGRPVSEMFSSFDDRPLGTASLAQVHAATLISGEPVAVKVLKPGVRQLVSIDMSFLRGAARILAWFPSFAELDIRAVARELCRVATGELDLQREAANLGFFHAAMDKDSLPHYTPAPFRALCAADVLTMERVEGVSTRDILSALHNGDRERLDEWARDGITPAGVARLIFRSVLEQSMRHRTFNADPHPSNLIIGKGCQLNWIDFGLVGWLDEKQWSIQLRLRQAFLRGEVHAAYRLFLESVGPFPPRDLRAFEVEMKQAIRDYIVAARDPDAPITERSTGAFLMSTLGALRRYHLPMSTEVMQLYRAILIADIVMLRLDPRVDWLAEMDDFLVEFVAEQAEEAVRSAVDDPSAFAAVVGLPSTLLAGADWLDRRLLIGAAPPATQPSLTDELVASLVRLVCLVAFLAIPLSLILATGAVTVAASSPWHGIVGWVGRNPVIAVIGVVVVNVFLRRWSVRFRR